MSILLFVSVLLLFISVCMNMFLLRELRKEQEDHIKTLDDQMNFLKLLKGKIK